MMTTDVPQYEPERTAFLEASKSQLANRPLLRILLAMLAGCLGAMAQQAKLPSTPAVVVVVHPRGFDQQTVNVPKPGIIMIAVHNRSGLRQLSLRLDRDAGPRLKDVPVPAEKNSWHEYIPLATGKYVLTEAAHPAWRCEIVVGAP